MTLPVGRVFYLLNPDGDLKGTQSQFESKFKSQTHWSGVIGSRPSESEFERGICESDVFL